MPDWYEYDSMYAVHLRHIRFHLCENSFPRSNTMDFVYGNGNGNEAEARAFNICYIDIIVIAKNTLER